MQKKIIVSMLLAAAVTGSALSASAAYVNSRGISDWKQNSAVSRAADLSVTQMDAAAARFADVSGHWALNQIGFLTATGTVSGFPDGNFHPDEDVTVDQFVTMVVKTVGTVVPSSDSADWFAPFKKQAIAQGLIASDTFSDFSRPITRMEMVRILNLVLTKYEITQAGVPSAEIKAKFNDISSLPSDDLTAVVRVVSEGIMSGFPDGTFQPSATGSRAMAASLMRNLQLPAYRSTIIRSATAATSAIERHCSMMGIDEKSTRTLLSLKDAFFSASPDASFYMIPTAQNSMNQASFSLVWGFNYKNPRFTLPLAEVRYKTAPLSPMGNAADYGTGVNIIVYDWASFSKANPTALTSMLKPIFGDSTAEARKTVDEAAASLLKDMRSAGVTRPITVGGVTFKLFKGENSGEIIVALN